MEICDTYICQQCSSKLQVYQYNKSLKKFGYVLCEDCQIWFISKVFNTTKEMMAFYFTLKQRGVPVLLEKKTHSRKITM
jgi:hypothetical protein